MTISEYKVKEDARAPRVNLNKREFQTYKIYTAGNLIKGYVWEATAATATPIIITQDGLFAIPASKLDLVRDISVDGVEVKDAPAASPAVSQGANKSPLPKEVSDKMAELKKASLVTNVVSKARNNSRGLFIGAALGLGVGVFAKKPLLPSILVGAIGGGFFAHIVTQSNKN